MKLEMFLPRDKMAAICNDILTVMIQQKQFLARIEVSIINRRIEIFIIANRICLIVKM